MPQIKLEKVVMKFGDFVAARDISVTINNGEYVTILGPSGCGKTTLIKMISGILHPTEGKVFIDGVDVTDIPIEDRDVGYVFQNIALFPHMDLKDNVGYGPRVRNKTEAEQDQIAEEYLQLVKMLDRCGYVPSELSGGEQQKVAIARALASGSKVIMLDEPLSALDARVRVELRYDIRRLVKKLGITVLHVTHDQEEAMSVSDRIILMKKGTIHEIGTPLEIYRNPKSIFAAHFIGETNLIECTVVKRTKKNNMQVVLRDGSITRVAGLSFEVGDPVVLSVRPEHVYTANEGIPAVVRDVVFMGTYWRVRTEAGSEDLIDYNIPIEVEAPSKGDAVYLVFNKRAVRLFARPQQGLQEEILLE